MGKRRQLVVFVVVVVALFALIEAVGKPAPVNRNAPIGLTATPTIDAAIVRSEALRVASLDAGRNVAADDPLARHAATVLGLLDQHCTEPLPTLVNSAVAATATLKQAGFARGPVQILEDTMVALPTYVTRISCAHWIPEDVTLTEQGG